MRQFTLEYWKDDDWYVGRLKEVPGVFSQGETLEELEENVKDAYRFADHKEQMIDLLQNVETFEKNSKHLIWQPCWRKPRLIWKNAVFVPLASS